MSHSALAPVGAFARRQVYVGRFARIADRMPQDLRVRLGWDDSAAIGSRRIEIGSGSRPQPGFLHVDTNARAPHVEVVAAAWRLPFESDWADEILAIHVLEHVHPRLLARTLSEWHRVLAPGGSLRVHVPDSAALMRAYLAATGDQKWTLVAALLGMYANPSVRAPEQIESDVDHRILFDREMLTNALRSAGFANVQDLTASVDDIHTTTWKPVVDRISLVFQAEKT
jgi:SAM-dependent methyltransferase